MHKNLYHKDNKELSSKFFHKAMELSESKGGQYYLVLSILFRDRKESTVTVYCKSLSTFLHQGNSSICNPNCKTLDD